MFCPKCGAKLSDGAKFCGQCGAPAPMQEPATPEPAQAPAPAAEAPAPEAAPAPQPEAPEPPQKEAPAVPPEAPEPILRRSHGLLQKRQEAAPSGVPGAAQTAGAAGEPILGKRRHGVAILAGLIAAGVAVIALVALLVVPAVVQMVSPKAYLAACAGNTAAAYASALEKTGKALNLDGLADAAAKKRMESTLDISLSSAPGASELLGAGFSMKSQVDLDGKEAAYDLRLRYGAADLGSLQVYLKDDLAALGSREFTNSKFYGVHTETLGGDILSSDWGAASGVDEDLSFDLFEMMELYQEPQNILTEETYADLAAASADLVGESQVKKLGKEEKTINSQSETLKMYAIEFSPAALAAYVYDCTELILTDENLYELMEPSLAAQAAQRGMEASAFYEQMVEQTLREMDPDALEVQMANWICSLDIGVRGKQIAYLSLQAADKELGAQAVSLTAELGTKDSLINDLTVTVSEGGIGAMAPALILRSSGNHEGKDGAFSDQTSLVLDGSPALTMATDFNAKETTDNFRFTLQGNDVNFQMDGSVQAGSNKLDAQFDNIRLTSEGETLGLSASYTVGPCRKLDFTAKDARILTDMSTAEIQSLSQEIERNTQTVLLGLMRSGSFF